MKLSSDTYWIGDDTGTCQMKLDSKLMDTLAMTKSQLIEEGKSYRLWFKDIIDTMDEERTVIIREKSDIHELNWKVNVPIIAMQKSPQNESTKWVRIRSNILLL